MAFEYSELELDLWETEHFAKLEDREMQELNRDERNDYVNR